MDDTTERTQQQSILHMLLSFFVPGLGQIVAREWSRGISLLASTLILGWLSVWTVSQRARFPDLSVGWAVYSKLVLASLAILIFLFAIRQLSTSYVFKDPAVQASTTLGVGLVFILVLILVQENLLGFAGSEEQLAMVFGGTAIFSAGALAALHLWQVSDAGRIGAGTAKPSVGNGILLGCVVIFSLGWQLTEIDLQKAIEEYEDISIVLGDIVWPWRTAFEFEQIAIESEAKVQAPCPEGSTGPEVNQPVSGEAWLSVTPTCGDLSVRELATGTVTFGTELTLTGGGYTPGAEVQILWKNPIGNPFTPRGVGETDIIIDRNGEFTSILIIPEVAIPSTAVGDQIHTVIIRQESGEIFTGNFSDEMILSLQKILETIMIGLMATFFGVLFAFPFSFLAAKNLMAPITAQLVRLVGSLIGMIIGAYLTLILGGLISDQLGGLSESPIQIALSAFVILLLLGYFGSKLVGGLFEFIARQISPLAGQIITSLGLGTIFGVLGYGLGIGFSRGIIAIPQGADVAAINEPSYAMAGAALVGLFGIGFGFLRANQEFSAGMLVYTIARTLMNVIRSIEPLIWAIVASIWVGLGPFAGTIALTLHTIAALGKLYSESIESIDSGPIEALQATGANRLQTIIYAVVPQILPPYISFTIYRWDINVRMSTILGLVGGGGIGFLLIQWIRLFDYSAAGIAVWLITITVATLDYVSSNIRERFV